MAFDYEELKTHLTEMGVPDNYIEKAGQVGAVLDVLRKMFFDDCPEEIQMGALAILLDAVSKNIDQPVHFVACRLTEDVVKHRLGLL